MLFKMTVSCLNVSYVFHLFLATRRIGYLAKEEEKTVNKHNLKSAHICSLC